MPQPIEWSSIQPIVTQYEELPAACHDYDPRAPQVALLLEQMITRRLPEIVVEHVGSTSVPGCAGKGVIDLMVVYPNGELEGTKALLDALGFQRQTGRDPFPESRPMRKGAIEFDGARFRIHAHVIARDSAEVEELRSFRDHLRADVELLAAYVARKREILAAGVTDSLNYSYAKGEFIQQRLKQD
ncbi:MAG: GrpB family protein [Blastocatellia bacterium]